MPEKAGRELVAKSDPARILDDSTALLLAFFRTQRKSILREKEKGKGARERKKTVVAAESLHF